MGHFSLVVKVMGEAVEVLRALPQGPEDKAGAAAQKFGYLLGPVALAIQDLYRCLLSGQWPDPGDVTGIGMCARVLLAYVAYDFDVTAAVLVLDLDDLDVAPGGPHCRSHAPGATSTKLTLFGPVSTARALSLD